MERSTSRLQCVVRRRRGCARGQHAMPQPSQHSIDIASQHSTAQHSTAQHSTAQHSAPLILDPLGTVRPRPRQLARHVGVQRQLHVAAVEVGLRLRVDAGVVVLAWEVGWRRECRLLSDWAAECDAWVAALAQKWLKRMAEERQLVPLLAFQAAPWLSSKPMHPTCVADGSHPLKRPLHYPPSLTQHGLGAESGRVALQHEPQLACLAGREGRRPAGCGCIQASRC